MDIVGLVCASGARVGGAVSAARVVEALRALAAEAWTEETRRLLETVARDISETRGDTIGEWRSLLLDALTETRGELPESYLCELAAAECGRELAGEARAAARAENPVGSHLGSLAALIGEGGGR